MSLNQSKKLLWPVFAFMLLAACTQLKSFHEDDSLSKDGVSVSMDVIQPIINHISSGERIWLVAKKSIPANTVLKYSPYGFYDPDDEDCGTVQSPDFEAWLINFSGNVRRINPTEGELCVFVNVSTGEYKTAPINGQICDIEWDDSTYKIADDSPVIGNSEDIGETATISKEARAAVANHYAVIISGGIDRNHNLYQYWNDCQYIYKRLTQSLGYDKSHIYCLVSDGNNPGEDMLVIYDDHISFDGHYSNAVICDWENSPVDFDDDGVADYKYAATKQNISWVFNQLKSEAASIDHLLVFVTGTGARGGKICLWKNQQMTIGEFDTELRKLPNVKMDIVMGQDYSGEFISLCGPKNRTVATACSASEKSYGYALCTNTCFLYQWTNALDPMMSIIVDENIDNMVSLQEVFDYAKAYDPAAIDNEEHPQFASAPNYYGSLHDLERTYYEPIITGSDNLQSGKQYTYTISGLPPSVTVNWVGLGEISLSSPTNTSVKVRSTLPSNEYVSSYPAGVMAEFTYSGTELWASKEIQSIWNYGYYFNQDYIKYVGPGRYTVYTGFGATGYQWVCSNPYFTIWPPQGSREVEVSGPYTGEPVILWVTFQNPFGEGITVGQEIQQTLNL